MCIIKSCNGDMVIVDRATAEIMEKEINHQQQQNLMKNNDKIDYRGERLTKLPVGAWALLIRFWISDLMMVRKPYLIKTPK